MTENQVISVEESPRRLDLRLRYLNRTLTVLSIPAIMEYSLASTVFLVDTLIVGWLRNETYLAATALSGIAMFFVNAPFIALSISTSSIVARSWGEGDRRTACRFAALSLFIAFSSAAGLAVLGILSSEWIVRVMGGSPDVVAVGSRYLSILMTSCVFGLPMFISNGIHRSKGDTMRAMWISLLMNLINIITSIMLAFGWGAPKLGYYGVAWGTVLSRTAGSILSVGWLWSPASIQLRLAHFRDISKTMLSRLWYLTAPALAERVINSVANVVFLRLVAELGTTVLAAHQLTVQIENFVSTPVWGLAIAATAMVGQSIGANLDHIAEIAVRRLLFTTGLLMMCLSILFLTAGPYIVRIFGATPEVLSLSGTAMRLAALEMPFLSITIVFIGALRGAGDTKTPLIVGLICTMLVRVGGTWLLAFVLKQGLVGVWLATAADWATRAVTLFFFFRKGMWKKLHQLEKARFRES